MRISNRITSSACVNRISIVRQDLQYVLFTLEYFSILLVLIFCTLFSVWRQKPDKLPNSAVSRLFSEYKMLFRKSVFLWNITPACLFIHDFVQASTNHRLQIPLIRCHSRVKLFEYKFPFVRLKRQIAQPRAFSI